MAIARRLQQSFIMVVILLPVWACQGGLREEVSLARQAQIPEAQIDVPATRDIIKDDLRVTQVEADHRKGEDTWSGVLNFEQLETVTGPGVSGFSFEDVQGDHPCRGAGQGTDQCAAVSKALSDAAARDANQKTGRRSAEAELQSLTNQVIDPGSFDPERTIDEIGRGNQLNSLASQALGSEFLNGSLPIPDTAPTPDEVPDLPPIVLDITVTQSAGTP